jgi:hypothetical protein
MKSILLPLLCLLPLLPVGPLLGQGSLTPTGGPAPTMKSLDQIDAKLESRTPISSAPFTISTSGSYYLTGNLTVTSGDAITIAADGVSLDLRGFTIASTASPFGGIAVAINGARTNIHVHNGQIQGATTLSGTTFTKAGFADGVVVADAASANVRIHDLSIARVGARGIAVADATTTTLVVDRCVVSICGAQGISASVVRDCSVEKAGNTGIAGEIAINCSADVVSTSPTNTSGIVVSRIATNCRGVSVGGIGLSTKIAENCIGISTSAIGLLASGSASGSSGTSTSAIGLQANESATGCSGTSTTATGLSTVMAFNCYGFSTSGTAGLSVIGTANSCRGKRDGGTAITAPITIGCSVNGTGSITSASKHLGTP